jgi:flavin reductase (DIM6/NTAB) family NADH-FMN oxidoreductase RutF
MTPQKIAWTLGQKIESPVQSQITLDPDTLSTTEIYKLLVGTIIPRPIAFVSTQNKEGKGNLAPFSSFNLVGSNPPTLVFSVARHKDGGKKDTLRNIEETGEFVVHTASSWLAEPLVHCGGEFPPEINEMELVGLTPIPSIKVKPSRVKESAVHFECKTYKLVEVGDGTAGSVTMVIGRIVLFHIFSDALVEGRVHHSPLSPVSRLGGISYAGIGDTFERAIPHVAKAEEKKR